MRKEAIFLGVLLSLGTGAAAAQGVNLTGRYICVNCPPHQRPNVGFHHAKRLESQSRE
jgi:hypothetical protein